MNIIDGAILAIAAFALAIWIRGCLKASASDCSLGQAVAVSRAPRRIYVRAEAK